MKVKCFLCGDEIEEENAETSWAMPVESADNPVPRGEKQDKYICKVCATDIMIEEMKPVERVVN